MYSKVEGLLGAALVMMSISKDVTEECEHESSQVSSQLTSSEIETLKV